MAGEKLKDSCTGKLLVYHAALRHSHRLKSICFLVHHQLFVSASEKMIKGKSSATLLLYLASIFTLSLARPIFELPHESASSLKINTTQVANAKKCSYTVKITTSCSSPRYTRDHISLSFGDAYGTQVYVPRLDDPSSGTFERCSTDTFQISGPCSYQICYLYLYRSGYDGWKPKSVTVYGYNSKAVTFYYDTFIPNDVWWGFNHCRRDSAASA